MDTTLKKSDIVPIIQLALDEDIGSGDVTSNAIFKGTEESEAVIFAKEEGIFCGGDIIRFIYEEIDPEIEVSPEIKDGTQLKPGDIVAKISGSTKNILIGERTVLNFIQRMCGIATRTRKIRTLLEGTSITILDTRKTAPGLRQLDKYAVRTGGGLNHRMGLFDMVLIKDNHIKAAGGIAEAVKRVKSEHGKKYRIEVETTNLDEVQEALDSGADIIMLDNIDRETMEEACELIRGRGKIEISGNMDEEKIRDIMDLRVDYISIGALTHSVEAFDLSMRFVK
jgi:nicotinate-nucleotide pyrophosphorylase (carboxylating)